MFSIYKSFQYLRISFVEDVMNTQLIFTLYVDNVEWRRKLTGISILLILLLKLQENSRFCFGFEAMLHCIVRVWCLLASYMLGLVCWHTGRSGIKLLLHSIGISFPSLQEICFFLVYFYQNGLNTFGIKMSFMFSGISSAE